MRIHEIIDPGISSQEGSNLAKASDVCATTQHLENPVWSYRSTVYSWFLQAQQPSDTKQQEIEDERSKHSRNGIMKLSNKLIIFNN